MIFIVEKMNSAFSIKKECKCKQKLCLEDPSVKIHFWYSKSEFYEGENRKTSTGYKNFSTVNVDFLKELSKHSFNLIKN